MYSYLLSFKGLNLDTCFDPFNKQSLSVYEVLGSLLGVGEEAESKVPHGAYPVKGESDTQKN